VYVCVCVCLCVCVCVGVFSWICTLNACVGVGACVLYQHTCGKLHADLAAGVVLRRDLDPDRQRLQHALESSPPRYSQ
jgi:hypothetical protein